MKSPRRKALRNVVVGNVILPTLLLWAVAVAADPSLNERDRDFILQTASNGAVEVILGRLAEDNGSQERVRKLGAKIADQHAELNAALDRLASTKRLRVKAQPSAYRQQELDELRGLSGQKFDDRFASLTISQHQHSIRNFREASIGAEDKNIKRFAAEHLPILEGHLQHAVKLK